MAKLTSEYSRLRRLPTLVVTASILLAVAACSDRIRAPELEKVLTELESHFDKQYPGRGLTDYESDASQDVAKSYAMVLLGSIDRARAKGLHVLPAIGQAAGRWLLDHSDDNQNGVVGWGVPVAWDAYGDGSVNPRDTEYTISTAIAVHALLDWMEFSADAPKAQILATVAESLRPYLRLEMRSPSGMAPYSLMLADRRYDTFNPAAYLAGQLQRFSNLQPEPQMAAALRNTADATVSVLIAEKQLSPKRGAWYWNYSIQEKVPNDLPHASYIALGLSVYGQYGGKLAGSLINDRILDHLTEFVDSDAKAVRAWPNFRIDVDSPARLYDLGIAMRIACAKTGSPKLAAALIGQVASYRTDDGRYHKYPIAYANKTKLQNRVVAEYESYIYQGLAACVAHAAEERSG